MKRKPHNKDTHERMYNMARTHTHRRAGSQSGAVLKWGHQSSNKNNKICKFEDSFANNYYARGLPNRLILFDFKLQAQFCVRHWAGGRCNS